MADFARHMKYGLRSALMGLSVLALVGCVSIYRNHGYVPTDEDLESIKLGVDTRDSIAESIGTPSAEGVLNDSGFYYVSSRFRHYGAKEPEVVERELVALTFDQRGIVRNVEKFGLKDGRVIPLTRRISDSSVRDQTFLRQLLGNIGTFNPSNVLQ